MEKEKYNQKKTVSILVEPYLAEYARKKFAISPNGGGIKIPYTYDLYHCIFNRMQKPPLGAVIAKGGNLLISLPDSRAMTMRKPPQIWNYLSAEAMTDIEQCLRQLFNYDFHQQMIDNESQGRPRQQIEVVENFLRSYGIESLTPSALLKNFQRYRQRISPRKKRKYQKVARF